MDSDAPSLRRPSEGVTNGHVILLLTIVIRDRRHDVDESKVYRRHPSCYNCYNKNPVRAKAD